MRGTESSSSVGLVVAPCYRNWRALAAGLVSLAAASADAQDFLLAGGGAVHESASQGSFAMRVEYLEDLSTHLAVSFAYHNEGHIPGHHRDGQVAQLWLRTDPALPWSFAAGAGPYLYFD